MNDKTQPAPVATSAAVENSPYTASPDSSSSKSYDDRPRRDDRPRDNDRPRDFDRPRRDDRPRDNDKPRDFDRPQRDDRPRDNDRPRGAEGALIELDRDIMKLLVRRATLLSRIRGGKDHAGTPAAAQAEKSIRTAWEEGSLAFSKDPRFTRDLFALLQEIKVLAKDDLDGRGSFHLAPARQAIEGTATGPASSNAALMWMTLAAASPASMFADTRLTLSSVLFTDVILGACNTLKHMGINIEHAPTGNGIGSITVSPGTGFALKDTGIHTGDSPLLLYLMAFFSAGATGTCRFTGGPAMKNTDLAGLRHTLPLLGARLAHVIPHSQGLPAMMECSGIIPEEVEIPGDLPLEGVCALLLAPLVWNTPVTLNLAHLPASVATAALAKVSPLHRESGAQVTAYGPTVRFTPGPLALPATPCLPLEPTLAAYLLAIPAFAKGKATLTGQWPEHSPQAIQAAILLEWAGLTLDITAESITASHAEPSPAPLPALEISPALAPLFFAIAAHKKFQGSFTFPELISFERESDIALAQDFLPRLGLQLNLDTFEIILAEKKEAWVSPDAFWSMALALSSYTAPGLNLVNPKTVTTIFPPFWAMYNALPTLANPAPPREQLKETAQAKPARRRIMTE